MEDDIKKKIRRKKLRGRVILALVVLLIAGIGVYSYIKIKQGKKLVYETEEITRGEIIALVSSTGTLSAVTTVDVGSQVSGTIQEVYVDFNDRVKKGDVLARIDPSLYETQLEKTQAQLKKAIHQKEVAQSSLDKAKIDIQQAETNIHSARAQVEKAKADLENARGKYMVAKASLKKSEAQLKNDLAEYKRAEELYKLELISLSEKEKAQTTYQVSEAVVESDKANLRSSRANISAAESALDSAISNLKTAVSQKESAVATYRAEQSKLASAKASIKQAQSEVDSVNVNLARCVIRSPINGIVIDRRIEPGQTVAASFQTPVLFKLARNLELMEVKALVDEADIGKVKEGQEVEFTVDAFPGERFKGKIQQVRSSPRTEQNVVTYEVIIQTRNKEMKLKPGMTANIDITVDVKDDVIRIPNAALRFRPERVPDFPYPEDVKKEMVKKEKEEKEKKHEKEKKEEKDGDSAGEEKELTPVWILINNKPLRYKVELGISDNSYTEMKSGDLKKGMKAITDVKTAKKQKEEEKRRRGRVRF